MHIERLFTDHPHSIGETYGQHGRRALYFGMRMILAGVACVIHAVFPFLFVRTASKTIAELNDRMVVNRSHRSGYSARHAQVRQHP